MTVKDIVGIVANGEMGKKFPESVNKCTRIIAADGGFNHCIDKGITPHVLVGDLDSVRKEAFSKKGLEVHRYDRDKDFTDLEGALKVARISEVSRVIIYGGLGGRIDHTLYNIYLLLKHPGKLILETKNEVVFSVSPEQNNIRLSERKWQKLSLIALYDPIEGVKVVGTRQKGEIQTLCRDNSPYTLDCLTDDVSVKVKRGTVIGVFHNDQNPSIEYPKKESFQHDFGIKVTFPHHFRVLHHLAKFPMKTVMKTDDVRVFALHNQSMTFDSTPGQTISLIPLFGPAREIVTEGLRWTGKEFTKDFISLSNVSTEKKVTISVKGYLACIINTTLIDLEMLPKEKK